MKKALSLLTLTIFPALSGCMAESNADSQLPSPETEYVELNRGQITQNGIYTKKQAKVIATQTDYAAELANYTNATPTTVDFTKGKVLLVDMGGRNTGGYSVGVTSVVAGGNFVVANIKLVTPGQSCIVTLALSNPYQFVFIPSLKEILVSETLEVINC